MAKIYTEEENIAWLKSLHGNPSGAAMLLETPDGRLVIVKANYKQHWTLPSGVIDENESPHQAAIREVKEEVGLDINPDDAKFQSVIYRKSKDIDTYLFVFLAKITNGMVDSIVLRESEIEEFAVETTKELSKADRSYSSVIVDWCRGRTVVGYGEQTIE